MTRPDRPRARALARPRVRSASFRSMPVPAAPGAAARMRSMSSPHPQPMSRIVPGLARVSLAVSCAALASDMGPWKASWLRPSGGSSFATGPR